MVAPSLPYTYTAEKYEVYIWYNAGATQDFLKINMMLY